MSTNAPAEKPASSGGRGGGPTTFDYWKDSIPQSVDYEDAMGAEGVAATWTKLYRAADQATASESVKRSIRAAVYEYCAKNGTSRKGEYAGNMMLAGGQKVAAAVIPQAANKMMIRKFMRGNMKESYEYFKATGVMENDAKFVARAAALGISPQNAFAMADWFGDCPYLTPGESAAYDKSFSVGVRRAANARGGKTLEEVETDDLDEYVASQRADAGGSHQKGSAVW